MLPWCAAPTPVQHYIHAPTMYEIQSVRTPRLHTAAPLCCVSGAACLTQTGPTLGVSCSASDFVSLFAHNEQMTNRKLKFGTAIVAIVVTGFGIPIWAANRAIRKAKG